MEQIMEFRLDFYFNYLKQLMIINRITIFDQAN
jgi:hypothetical protein